MSLSLLLYVLLRGLDATVLKGLQELGLANPVQGENPISFCNVFFLAQLTVALASLLPGRRRLIGDLARLGPADWRLLALHGGLGLFLGPVAYYFALESLSVISQTLLFALVLPVSALLARWLLGEALPPGFWLSLALIGAGLLLPQAAMAIGNGQMDDAAGLAWALVGVLAFAGSAVSGRSVARRRWPASVAVGVPTLLSALVFGAIALVLFGPHHFLLLRLWWVAGVIGLYAITLSLGRELALRQAYRSCSVAVVSLWGSLSLVVAVLSAALLLGEPLGVPVLGGLALVLAGVGASRWPGPIRSAPSPVPGERQLRRTPPGRDTL
ncbi:MULTISPECIES: DMT family transporter [unclassified Cyanobium]|uniref:DMT family transporter n=1 Tax=unclassified Cyanobium TaxID=2627006 RepID=UPI0020CCB2EE|nr:MULTISPECIES: DMT family transporter [unclassified Cyanobium]MCP9835747.1 DMT family transporter [Cyanobium sp. La Preciosa 7G6]MCP9938495.1 DMT family transporter [Cyanobium sp. Aljojuca 7A6]